MYTAKTRGRKDYTNKLQELNRSKDKFFSIIAHDLRSPFNSFLNLTEMLLNKMQSIPRDKIQQYVSAINESASSLLCLLENLLEWSKVNRGTIDFRQEKLQLAYTIKQTIYIFLETSRQKEIELKVQIPEDININADKRMLDTITRNLASNALKFTPFKGRVTITAKNQPDKLVMISIKDTGIGLREEIIDKLFSLDANISRPGTEGEPSSGLGLILCKEFVEKHGGKIWAESEENKGSTFFFTIPEAVSE